MHWDMTPGGGKSAAVGCWTLAVGCESAFHRDVIPNSPSAGWRKRELTKDWLWAAAMVGSYLPRLCAPSAAVKAACRRKVRLPITSERVRDDNHVGGGSYSYANASIGSFCADLMAG